MSDNKPAVKLTERYAEAVAYASALHAKQTCKPTTLPYVSTLLGVSSFILEEARETPRICI